MKLILTIIALLVFVLEGCAPGPKLYPNDKLRRTGKKNAERDIDACMELANKRIRDEKTPEAPKNKKTSEQGALAGAMLGALSGKGAASGALVGGSVAREEGATLTPKERRHGFVDKCLMDKGYVVEEWK